MIYIIQSASSYISQRITTGSLFGYNISEKFIVTMPKKNQKLIEISQTDCPQDKAPKYPGWFNRNNPSGSVLSKPEFIKCIVESWVKHFGESEKYENTNLAHKTMYLKDYLSEYVTQRFKSKQIGHLLARVEVELGLTRHKGDYSYRRR